MKKLLSSMFIVMLMLTLVAGNTRASKGEDPNDGKPFIPCDLEYSVEV